jgi:hypothetical protein
MSSTSAWRVSPVTWLKRTRTSPIVWSTGRSPTNVMAWPPIERLSTREAPEETVRSPAQLATCEASMWPTEIPDASPSCAPSRLELAAITPGPRRVSALGSRTVSGPSGWAAAVRWLWVVQGAPAGLATVGSLVTCVETVARPALARQLAADCAAAGEAAASAAISARPPQTGSRRPRRRDRRPLA